MTEYNDLLIKDKDGKYQPNIEPRYGEIRPIQVDGDVKLHRVGMAIPVVDDIIKRELLGEWIETLGFETLLENPDVEVEAADIKTAVASIMSKLSLGCFMYHFDRTLKEYAAIRCRGSFKTQLRFINKGLDYMNVSVRKKNNSASYKIFNRGMQRANRRRM